MGLLLMAAAGYDPRESVEFWKRMSKATGAAPSEFLSTHPSHATRVRDLTNWLQEAKHLYDNSPEKSRAIVLPGVDSL